MSRSAVSLLALVVCFAFCAGPAEALTGFVSETQFRSFDPFAVDVYVEFLAPLTNTFLGTTGYYDFSTPYMEQGGFPVNGGYASVFYDYNDVYEYVRGITAAFGADTLGINPFGLIGVDFTQFSALGFFLEDTIDHNNYINGGEYITRVSEDTSGMQIKLREGLRGVNDVFIGYINDVTGFNGLWAGWYRSDGSGIEVTRSAEFRGQYNAFNHLLVPAAYVGTGGDPHLVSRGTTSEMTNVMAGDIVNLVDSVHLSVNAAVREFSFLPESMRENNYFGTVAAHLATGELLVVEAFEVEGVPTFSVELDGTQLEEGSLVQQATFRVQYDAFENLDGAHGESWFAKTFPFQQHNAIVRVWVLDELVVDVSLSSKDHFVDWHHAAPVVHEENGAFLNVNMRDLRQEASTGGLLRAVDSVHQRKLMRQRAIDAGQPLVRDVDVDFKAEVHRVVDAHRVESLF